MVNSDPPFYRYAAKFVAALAAAVVGTSATILAAVDDDHVTGKEWAAIILGVLALLVGPAVVYGVANAPKRRGPALAAAPVDGSAAAQRAYPSPKPPPTQRAAASDPWISPDEP